LVQRDLLDALVDIVDGEIGEPMGRGTFGGDRGAVDDSGDRLIVELGDPLGALGHRHLFEGPADGLAVEGLGTLHVIGP
jgi:hypothetical protein